MYNIEIQVFDGDTAKTSKFSGSSGWLSRFISRKNMKLSPCFEESVIVDHQRISTFIDEFHDIASQYNPNLIFHFDECGLVWNIDKYKDPALITQQHKNTVTLLLGNYLTLAFW